MTLQNNNSVRDTWLLFLKCLVFLGYVSLIFIKPSGEGWGRGWNLIAYWIYVAPAVLAVGGLHLWRQRVIAARYRGVDVFTLVAAFIFPIISLVILKLKS